MLLERQQVENKTIQRSEVFLEQYQIKEEIIMPTVSLQKRKIFNLITQKYSSLLQIKYSNERTLLQKEFTKNLN